MQENNGFDRRIGQFYGYIQPMYKRSREVMGFCYVIFEEAFTDESGNVHRSATKAKVKSAVPAGAAVGSGMGDADGRDLLDALDAEIEAGHPRNRYVQIGFCENYFFVDLPSCAYFPDEADEISGTRPGFRRASDNPASPTSDEHTGDFDPLQKFYLYGEELEAAEDVAHIFFRVLGLPTDTRLYVTASSSSGRTWERGEPFE